MRLAPDDALDPLWAEAGRFRLLHDVAHLVAQAAGQLALLVAGVAGRVAVAARAVVVVAVAVLAARLGLLFRAAVAHAVAAERAFALFVAVAAARAVVAAAVLAARLNRIFRAAVPATHAAGRPSAAASLVNDNRYVRQFISPIYWPVLRPAQRRGMTFALAVTLHRSPIWHWSVLSIY